MTGSPVKLVDAAGRVHFEGTNQAPGGGSIPQGVVRSADYLFTEEATAGVYTAPPLDLPENAFLLDVQWWLTDADWAADTAVIDVVDSALGALITAQDVKGGNPYLAVSAAQTVDLAQPSVYPNLSGGNVEVAGGGVLTATITTTIAVPPVAPAAAMIVRLVYLLPPTPVAAVFA